MIEEFKMHGLYHTALCKYVKVEGAVVDHASTIQRNEEGYWHMFKV